MVETKAKARPEVKALNVRFGVEGTVEISATYSYPENWLARPGTKKRIDQATVAAGVALRYVLAALDDEQVPIQWGGFGQDERITTDHLLIEKGEGY